MFTLNQIGSYCFIFGYMFTTSREVSKKNKKNPKNVLNFYNSIINTLKVDNLINEFKLLYKILINCTISKTRL